MLALKHARFTGQRPSERRISAASHGAAAGKDGSGSLPLPHRRRTRSAGENAFASKTYERQHDHEALKSRKLSLNLCHSGFSSPTAVICSFQLSVFRRGEFPCRSCVFSRLRDLALRGGTMFRTAGTGRSQVACICTRTPSIRLRSRQCVSGRCKQSRRR